MAGEVISKLISAVHQFVLHRTRPEDGILIEARQLADRWKLGGQSLFDSATPDLTLLLAALVVTYREDHELLELIRRHRAEELNKLIRDSVDAEAQALASERLNTESTLTLKQRLEQRRRKWNRDLSRSIEFQFGASIETLLGARRWLWLLFEPTKQQDMIRQSQTCLDDIFEGKSVNMLRLEELFWMDRRRFAKVWRGFQKREFNYLAVVKIMDFLLNEKRRTKRKRSRRVRSPRLWLDDSALRMRVLRGIEARINSLPVAKEIATAFIAVIRAPSPGSGKK